MSEKTDLQTLRARDFWASLVLLGVTVFFLWETKNIPLWGENRSGVSGTDWYTSAALVPLGIFFGLLFLSLGLLFVSVRDGGARVALSRAGLGWRGDDVQRVLTIAVVLSAYIVGLVPRVDFIISSGLLITALVFGFHGGHAWRANVSALFIALPALYAFVFHWPQSQWNALADDWVALAVWVALTAVALVSAGRETVIRVLPVIAVMAPVILVSAMAFGFRQNVPARNGLLFKQIEYHYYVTLRPMWRE